jgi:putative tryptophan/tyrosine transport system substrate-binding protein
MRRREFIMLIGGAAAAWPLTAFGRVQRIAMVSGFFPVTEMSETSGEPAFQALFKQLRRLGYVEGQNLLIERYSGEGRAEHYPDLAREVVGSNPELIVILAGNEFALDFKAATTTIPIVGIFSSPVEMGFVASLARPGGNITGVAVDAALDEWYKRVQLLQQLVPHATRFGFLESRAVREVWGAQKRELELRMGVTHVGPPFEHLADEAEYRRVFAATAEDGADALLVTQEPENVTNVKLIVELAEKHRLPAIYTLKRFVEAGGLMSYGIDFSAMGHSVADVVGQVLKGEKPSEIPIRQPTKFEFVINLKTAKALGLMVPATMLVAADEVIE